MCLESLIQVLLYFRDIRDLKAQLSSTTSSSQQQVYQELLQDRNAVRADRDKLLDDILQLQKETSRLTTLEQQLTAAVQSLLCANIHCAYCYSAAFLLLVAPGVGTSSILLLLQAFLCIYGACTLLVIQL